MAYNLVLTTYQPSEIRIYDGFSSTILSSWSGDRTGLAFDGTNLISSQQETIYIHDGISSTILSSFAPPAYACGDLAFDGSNLISCDTNADRIYIHDGISSTILSSFASPKDQPAGLVFDGTNLISGYNNAFAPNVIYIHDAISSAVLSSFSAPGGGFITALAFDGSNLISGSWNSDKMYLHDGISSAVLSSFSVKDPFGATVVPTAKPSAPTNLKCEGAVNPTNVTDKNPELTAIYGHFYRYDGRYYRVQVSRISDFSNIVWDSGKKRLPEDISNGDTCQPITVRQTLNLDGSKYYWRIKFYDTEGNEGDWSTE